MPTKVLALLMITLLLGCAIPTKTTLPTLETQTFTPKVTRAAPSLTATPLKSATSVATPTSTRLPTNTPTLTPRPTLTVDAAKTLILGLVQEHKGCQLPCLWGFIPGITELKTAREFVDQFGIGDFRIGDIELGAHTYGDGGSVGITYPIDNTYIIVHWAYNKGKESSKLNILTLSLRAMESLGIDPINQLPMLAPVWGTRIFNEELQDYLLPGILSTYGQPEQVFLTVPPDDPESPEIKYHPFSLALVYPNQGIFIEYVSLRERIGSNYIGCPDKSHVNLAVWDPAQEVPLETLVEAGSEMMLSILKPIDKATSMTLDEFYQKYKDPKNSSCIKTPAELWFQP